MSYVVCSRFGSLEVVKTAKLNSFFTISIFFDKDIKLMCSCVVVDDDNRHVGVALVGDDES